jgi:hypothetical protein
MQSHKIVTSLQTLAAPLSFNITEKSGSSSHFSLNYFGNGTQGTYKYYIQVMAVGGFSLYEPITFSIINTEYIVKPQLFKQTQFFFLS